MSSSSSESGKQLSESACVRLLERLHTSGRVRVVRTARGDVVSVAAAMSAVRACVAEAGGRAPLATLAALVDVPLDELRRAVLEPHVRPQASLEAVLVDLAESTDDDALAVCGDWLVSARFVRGVLADVRRDVRESAVLAVSLDDLVRRYSLPAAPLAALLRQCCCDDGASFDADARALLAPGYARRTDAAVRGALLSFDEQPVSIDAVADAARLPRDVVVRVAERLIRNGSVAGTLDGHTFTPSARARERELFLAEFLPANGFVEFAAVDAFRSGSAKALLGARDDGVLLETLFVSHAVVSAVDAALASVLDDGFAERATVLPSFMAERGAGDVSRLLAHCACADQVLALSSFFVARSLVARCDRWLRTTYRLMRDAAARAPRAAKAAAAAATVDVDAEALAALRRCCSDAAVPDALLDELWREQLRDECVQARAQRLRAPLSDAELAAVQSRDRDATKVFQSRVVALHFYVQHLQRSHAALADVSESERAALDQHLLRTLCASILNLVVAQRVLVHGVVAVELCSAADGGTVADAAAMPPAVRDALAALVPERRALAALAGATSVEAFMQLLAGASDELGVPVQELDRRKEKSLTKSQCQLLREQLASVVEPSTVLHQAALLLYATHTRSLCHVPADRVGLLLRLLRPRLDAAVLGQLEQHSALVQQQHAAPGDARVAAQLADCAAATRSLVLAQLEPPSLASSTSAGE